MEQNLYISTEGNELIIRNGRALDEFDYKGFQYSAYSTDSFIRLVKEKANQEHCVVAYDDNGMTAILDDKIIDREQDKISYHFKKSLQYKEWKEILSDCVMNQKAFIKFLQRREEGEVENIEKLLYALQNFKYVTNIEGDFSQQDSHNYTFAFKSKEGEGTVKIPQILNINLEFLNESNFVQSVEIEIEVYKPKEAGEAPGFKLECPKLERYEKKAVENEIDVLKKNLDGFLVVTGDI